MVRLFFLGFFFHAGSPVVWDDVKPVTTTSSSLRSLLGLWALFSDSGPVFQYGNLPCFLDLWIPFPPFTGLLWNRFPFLHDMVSLR